VNGTTSIAPMGSRIEAGARASSGASGDFAGYPTSYLVNRFGDRQAQGRF
jgi:hypothetical protein